MTEIIFPIRDPRAFLDELATKHELQLAEEIHEQYYTFASGDHSTLQLIVSDDGNYLQGRKKTIGGVEVTQFPVGRDFANLKEILEETLGLLSSIEVRETGYEIDSAQFSICKLEERNYVIKVVGYHQQNLEEVVGILGLDMNAGTTQSFHELLGN